MSIKRTVFLLRSPDNHPLFMLLVSHKNKPLAQLESISVPGTLTEHVNPRLSLRQIQRYRTLIQDTFGTHAMDEIYRSLLDTVEAEHVALPPEGTPSDGFYLLSTPPFSYAHIRAYNALMHGASNPWEGIHTPQTTPTRATRASRASKASGATTPTTGTPPATKKPAGRPPNPPEYPVSPMELAELKAAQEKWGWNIPSFEANRFDSYVLAWIAAARKAEKPLKKQTTAYVFMSLYKRLQATAEFYVPPLDLFIERTKRGCGGPWHWPPATVWLSRIMLNYDMPQLMNAQILKTNWNTEVLLHSLDPQGSHDWLAENTDTTAASGFDTHPTPWIDAYLYDDTLEPPTYLSNHLKGKQYADDYLQVYQLAADDPRVTPT